MKKIILLLFITFNAWADCQKTETRIIFDKKAALEKETICTAKHSENIQYYISKSCEKDACEILKRVPRETTIPHYTSNIGSPGFKLCQALGGVPQIFEFKKNGDWESASRCLFGKSDFVEISLLSSKWKSLIR